MVRSHIFAWVLGSLLLLALAAPLQAVITPSGDLYPTGLDWWIGGGSPYTEAFIGKTGTGSVTINLGSYLTSYKGRIGRYPGSVGVVTVDGNGSTWDSNWALHVGQEGQGTLNITNGGAVSNSYGYIGTWYDSAGDVTVDGNGSTWTNGDLTVGRYSQGTLDITDGGTVINCDGDIGYSSDSAGVATVDGSGSTWTNNGNLTVGIYGQGTLNITNGGDVSNADGRIGFYSGSTGEVTVGGAGSTWTNSGNLYVGGYHSSSGGTGELNVSNGGSVEVCSILNVWGTGSLNIGATGQVSVGESLVLVQDSTLTAADVGATIHMTGSAFQNESANSANLAGLGNLKMIFEGGTEDVDPFEAAGEDVGAVIGGFTEANFVLDTLQLGGTAAGGIQLIDHYDNQDDGTGVGEAVYVNNLIMNAGATIDLKWYNLYYLNGEDPKQFFCGDADLDGFVGQTDLDMVLGDWGENVPPADPRADLTGDGFVGQGDLDTVLGNWGEGTGSIPEPATLLLVAIGACMGLRRRIK